MLGRSRSYFQGLETVLNPNKSPPSCRTDFLFYTFGGIHFISFFTIRCYLSTLTAITQTLSDMTSQLRTVAMFVILTHDLVDDLRVRVECHVSSFSDSQHLSPTNWNLKNTFALQPCFRYTLYRHMTL